MGTCQSVGPRLDRVSGALVATRHKRRNTGWGCSVTPRWFLARIGRRGGVLPTGTRRRSGHGWMVLVLVLGCCRHRRFKNQVHLRDLFRRWENGRFSRLVRCDNKTNIQQVGDAGHDGGINNATRLSEIGGFFFGWGYFVWWAIHPALAQCSRFFLF